MAWILVTLAVALLAGLAQLYLPYPPRTFDLLGFKRDWQQAASRFESVVQSKKCKLKHPELLLGCEDLHYAGGYLYASCLLNYETRRRWMPGLGFRQLGKDRLAGTDGGFILDETVVAWDLESDKAVNLEFRGFPEGTDRSFHGFDINQVSPDNITFYLINHRVSGDTVEKFSHTPGTSHINYIKTISIPPKSGGGTPNANDIFALPELDFKNAFYITNDHKYNEGFMRKLEDFLLFKTGYVSYYDDDSGWKIVAENIVTANGITGSKHLPPSKQEPPKPTTPNEEEEDEEALSFGDQSKPEDVTNLIYVSGCHSGIIHVFSRDFNDPGVLTPIQQITLPFLSDNPSLSVPSGSNLIIAGHPNPIQVHPHCAEKTDSLSRPPSAGGVMRVNTRELGSKFYGGGGYTTQPEVEEIFLDPKGKLANATTTAILIENEGKLGDLFITGLTMEGILQCKDFI